MDGGMVEGGRFRMDGNGMKNGGGKGISTSG